MFSRAYGLRGRALPKPEPDTGPMGRDIIATYISLPARICTDINAGLQSRALCAMAVTAEEPLRYFTFHGQRPYY